MTLLLAVCVSVLRWLELYLHSDALVVAHLEMGALFTFLIRAFDFVTACCDAACGCESSPVSMSCALDLRL